MLEAITTIEFVTGFLAGALLCEVATKGVKAIFRDKVDDVTSD